MDTGWKSPGTMADDSSVGTLTWSNPDNAKVSDDNDASIAFNLTETTHYLKATNFGFAIPAGSTIDGILVEFERAGGGMGGVNDSAIKIVKGGIIKSTNRSTGASWNTPDYNIDFGSSSDLWGETWDADNINASDFGVVISATGGAANAYIDHIQIKIYYTALQTKTCTTKARIQIAGTKWITAEGNILSTINKTFTTKANIRHLFIKTCSTQGNIRAIKGTSINVKGNIKNTQTQQITVLANIKNNITAGELITKGNIRTSITKQLTAKARILQTLQYTISCRGDIYAGKEYTTTTKGRIKSCGPGKTVLVSPLGGTSVLSPVTFTWIIEQDCKNRNIHAQIQIDKTDITFGDLEANKFTFRDTDFEYYNGATWVPYPQAGIISVYYGNEARITINLTSGTKYWRVRQGVM